MKTNLPEAILTLIKESASPIDSFSGVVSKMHKYRFEEPILYRGLAKIALDLLGKDFIVDTYLDKASEQDIHNAQYCWHKQASEKLTRDELLEFVLMEDMPSFLKKASYEVGQVLNNIKELLKESSIKELALQGRARLGDEIALAPEILKKQRGELSEALDKAAMGPGANCGRMVTGAGIRSGASMRPMSGLSGKGMGANTLSGGSGVSMPSTGAGRTMRTMGRAGY
jgi:hypothetical protein